MPLRLCHRPIIVMLLVLALVGLSTWDVPPAYAALSATKTCTGSGGSSAVVGESMTCTLTITALATDIPNGTTITVTAIGNNYQFTAASCTAMPGTCTVQPPLPAVIAITCQTDACTTVTVSETMLVTSAMPTTVTQQVSVTTPGVAPITVVAAGFTLLPAFGQVFVATTGDDANNCQTRPTACRTLNRAMEVARDGDTVVVLAGTYTIEETVRVRRLVTIQPDSTGRVILRIRRGVTGFEVTSQGGPMLHTVIRGFTIGGNFQEGSSAPVFSLLTDSYTEIMNNIIGGDDLRINNGVVIGNSLNPNVHDNTFIGSTSPVAAPLLVIGRTISGFGVVSLECLGVVGYSVSSRVMIRTNAFTGGWTAGVWLCSDGAGEHRIEMNVFRNYFRGLALKDVANTVVADNQLIGGLSDGIILYGASLRNRISNNHIESHIAPGAAGIRIGWIADPLLPLDNLVTGNRLLRDTIGVYVFGARSTQITRNEIKISGVRTGILLSPATFLNDPATQPRDTFISENVIVFTGPCGAFLGCALRLLGVTVPVTAINNDWGFRFAIDVEGQIFHQVDERLLGLVTFIPFTNMSSQASPAASPTPVPGASPSPGSPVTPATTAGVPASSATTPGSGPVRTVQLSVGCTQITWPGVSGLSVVDAALTVSPPSAQRSVVIWRRSPGGQWESYSVDRPLASNQVFFLARNDPIAICVQEPATWTIVLEMGE